jgi:deazaflavin-dependent oxidoreductase (nitroreductase family)
MPEKIRELKPPRGLSRLFFRFPTWLYRLKLGWLFGERMLLLNHTGRKTGLPRQAVLEVVQHDKETDAYVVNVGFGEQTDWYQNLMANPEASIVVGRRRIDIYAEVVPPEAGGEIMVDFAQRHPLESRMSSLAGYKVDGSSEDWRALGRLMKFIALRPR